VPATRHGSVSHARRPEIDDALKRGTPRGIVATHSLEMGLNSGPWATTTPRYPLA